jgi:TatD DNase family protein
MIIKPQGALIDIGVNLTHDTFQEDLNAVIKRAQEAGVATMVVTGTSEDTSRQAQSLAHRYPGSLCATAGVHPHDASHWGPSTGDTLQALAATHEVVALGETGLDFFRDFSPRPQQIQVFEAQLALAGDLGMPVFLHERGAFEQFIGILRRYRSRFKSAVVHCFTGSAQQLVAYLELDLHIGITGWVCDERRGLHLRDLLPQIPLDRLMLETDAPYLLPRTLRPKPKDRRNEPAFLPHILETVADCLSLPPAIVAEATTQTAKTFFEL